MGRVLALTSNDELNALVCQRFTHVVGRADVYQLPPRDGTSGSPKATLALHQQGRFLFGEELTFPELGRRFRVGASIKSTSLTDDFDFEAFQAVYGEEAVPLFSINQSMALLPFAVDSPSSPKKGQKLISLIPPDDHSEAGAPG